MSHNSTIVRLIQIVARTSAVLAPGLSARLLELLFLTPRRWPLPAREVDWLTDARRSRLRFDATRELQLYSWGSGPTVLLAHGWAGRGSQLAAFVAPLVERGFRVVAFDAPGHGQSEGRQSALPEFALAIERLTAQVGPVRAIIAHSMGCAATTVAVSRGLDVERLVYLAPPANPGDYLVRAARFIGFGDTIAARTQARIERRFGYPFEMARSTSLAPSLEVPLLVFHDRQDREVPHDEGQRLVEAWPGAELITTRGLGHQRIIREPAVIDAAVEFLVSAEEQARRSQQGTPVLSSAA